MNNTLEICCYTYGSAVKAEKAGANRIELCDNYSEGGTTPSYAVIKKAITNLNIPVNVIVRPRGGDFRYSQSEFDLICEDVIKIKELGANGIVIGFLNADGNIDLEKTNEIIKLAGSMEVTFHRAFDMCLDQKIALQHLIDLGITRVLTSGGMNTAPEGIKEITKLIELADNKISIMPGSGVYSKNIEKLISETGAKEFHSSAKTFINSQMKYYNKNISMGGKVSVDEYKIISVDENEIKKIRRILDRS